MAVSAFNSYIKATNAMIDLLCKAAGIDSNPVSKITCVAEAGGIVQFTVERYGETEKVISALSPLVVIGPSNHPPLPPEDVPYVRADADNILRQFPST